MAMASGNTGTFGQCEDIHDFPGISLCLTSWGDGEGAQELMNSKRCVFNDGDN